MPETVFLEILRIWLFWNEDFPLCCIVFEVHIILITKWKNLHWHEFNCHPTTRSNLSCDSKKTNNAPTIKNGFHRKLDRWMIRIHQFWWRFRVTGWRVVWKKTPFLNVHNNKYIFMVKLNTSEQQRNTIVLFDTLDSRGKYWLHRKALIFYNQFQYYIIK